MKRLTSARTVAGAVGSLHGTSLVVLRTSVVARVSVVVTVAVVVVVVMSVVVTASAVVTSTSAVVAGVCSIVGVSVLVDRLGRIDSQLGAVRSRSAVGADTGTSAVVRRNCRVGQ